MLARILFLLAVLEVAPLIQATEANGKRTPSVTNLGTNCKLRNKALPNEYLDLLPKEKNGLAATSVLVGSPLSSKWRIDRISVDSHSFYEIFNRQFETYLTNYYYQEQWMVASSKDNYASSSKRDGLWIIEPAQTNTPVTIKHAVTGSYLTVPKGSFAQRNAILASTLSGDESKWEIIC